MSKTCQECNKENRDVAIFCKKCGKKILSEQAVSVLDALIGCNSLKSELERLMAMINQLKKRSHLGQMSLKINMHSIIVGHTGTGKTALSKILARLYYNEGITTKAQPIIVDAVDFEKWMQDFDNNLPKAKGGILFIDNAQKLLTGDYADSVKPIDKLFTEMDKFGADPIVILMGLPEGLENYLRKNPAVSNRFKYHFVLPDYSAAELTEICLKKLSNDYKIKPDDDAHKKLLACFKLKVKQKDDSFGNAHLAIRMAEDIFQNFISRISLENPDDVTFIADDIHAEPAKERSLDEIMQEMETFVGMEDVKQSVKDIAKTVSAGQERMRRGLSKDEKLSCHIVLTGNPGTGKTTVARKLGEIFEAIGFLDMGHVIEVDRSKMVGQYKGETAKLVNALCDKAMGGILFVDEAYTLVPLSSGGDKDSFGQEAVETLMKRMEDDRDKFVVIAAGYSIEMQQFLDANPGMKSRIDRTLHIADYNENELFKIFEIFVKKAGLKMNENAVALVNKKIQQLYESKDKDFGNGREMRKLFDNVIALQSKRLSTLNATEATDDDYITILAPDIPIKEQGELNLEECLAPLSKLTGLEDVKNEIKNLVSYLNIERQRVLNGGVKTPLSMHFVFTGNPGTGKTTVARIMADIFHALGLLPTNKLIEVDQAMLIAGHTGQTAIKTKQAIDKAMGGVLFIDEAYTLSPKDGGGFGQEAIDTLLKRMEDDRGKFIVIAAGYTFEMQGFLDANPGLRSRFNRDLHFADFKANELQSIFENLLEDKKLQLEEEARSLLPMFFQSLYNRRDKNFGNAREVRKIFDLTLKRQSRRISDMMENKTFTPDALALITREDIEGKQSDRKSLDEIFKELDGFIGMKEVKDAVREIAHSVALSQERVKRGLALQENFGLNIIITGNPGTGKTTVARKLGEVFKAIGFLQSGHVVETDRSNLVGQFKGETPKIVNEMCNRAMGGILFVDEAYTLVPSNASGEKDQYGIEAVETLMKRMEDDRGKFVVIAAGYQTQMDEFLRANDGMKSRFDKTIHIEDYNADELLGIFKMFVKNNKYEIAPEAEVPLQKCISEIYLGREKNFANGREMRKLFDQALARMSTRLSQITTDALTDDMLKTISVEDIPFKEEKQISLDEILSELNELIGLADVKNDIKELAHFLKTEKMRAQGGEKTEMPNLHYVYTGNPGTGKTTVARIMAKVFNSLGILPTSKLIETDRADFVAGYTGQTANKTKQTIDKAMGGVLFIDEAYTLVNGDNDSFGLEALNTLLKRMEDDRGRFIVIAAGYTGEMKELIEKNPGLKSRFNNTCHFSDYTPDELFQIFMKLAEKRRVIPNNEAAILVKNYLQDIYDKRDKNFGNARSVRNLFDNAIKKQSSRIAMAIENNTFTNEMLNEFKPEDIL